MGLASLRFPSVFMACCIVLGLLPSVSPLFLWPAVLFWACFPPFPLCFYGLLYYSGLASLRFPSVLMACCIVLGLPSSVSPLFLWPAVLSCSLLRPILSVGIFSLRFGFPEAW